MTSNNILDRIERSAGLPGLCNKLANALKPTDLQSLLLAVYQQRSAKRSPADVLQDYENNRFVAPTVAEPMQMQQVEMQLQKQMPDSFQQLELSPVCPLGTCAAIAAVSQHWSVATARNTEVVSDATNVLTLECAIQRRRSLAMDPKSTQRFHYCASHRLLRPQFNEDPRMLPHFRLWHMVSAGRDVGNLAFECEMLFTHAASYLRALVALLPSTVRLQWLLTDFHPHERAAHLERQLLSRLRADFTSVDVAATDARDTGRGYYRDLCFHLNAYLPGQAEPIQLGDGGSVDWTQRLIGSAKERLVISALSSERVASML